MKVMLAGSCTRVVEYRDGWSVEDDPITTSYDERNDDPKTPINNPGDDRRPTMTPTKC